jgi:small-conductance mechanosensitive channel
MVDTDNLAQIFRSPGTAQLLEFVLVLVAATVGVTLVQTVLPWLANRAFGRLRLTLLAIVPLLRLGIIVVALLTVVPLFVEPSWQNMVALLGAVGLALGFALKDYASSVIAGILALVERPYRNGDWITLDGHYGEVLDVGLRTVRLRTADDSVVSIPHQYLWTASVVNASDGHPSLQCIADFDLADPHDTASARRLLEDVALTSAYLHPRQPVVLVAAAQPWGTRYRLRAYPVQARQQFAFVTDLTLRGRTALADAGIRFACPPAASPPAP